jgi:cellulose synthase/poly-beta-1,6-N-acetylglucosamine synthase-like glycosyltransferase
VPRIARGEILIFVDADVVVAEGAVAAMVSRFREDDGIAAVFGSYDDHPGAPGYFSQYKNLAHAFVHRTAAVDVPTFWAGFGGIRAAVFRAVNGFDESYTRPCIEDIELGTRLAAGGWRTVVDPSLQACHLKPWTFVSMVRSDIRDRAIPWTRLILQSRQFPAALNIDWRARASVALCWTAIICLLCSLLVPAALTIAALAWRRPLVKSHLLRTSLRAVVRSAGRIGRPSRLSSTAANICHRCRRSARLRCINVDPGGRVAAPASSRGGVNSRHATRGTR